ncbi:Eaa protein [Escherichia coli E267]|nr:Eaa protein [Escherichia coli E267]
MAKPTITREQLEEWVAQFDEDGGCDATDRQLEALIRQSLAAMDSKPVAWTDEQELRDVDRGGCGYLFTVNPVTPHADERRIILLYRHAQPASEREQVRREHAEWSQATFSNVGPVGPLKHLSKEALEAAAEPGDLSEWADMQFLMWDAQRRAGITDAQITQAMIDKLAVNKQREWPEPKDGEPRLHIKSQPATQEVHDEK